jgi:hypothetical protein
MAKAVGEIKACGPRYTATFDWTAYDAVDWSKTRETKQEWLGYELGTLEILGTGVDRVCADPDCTGRRVKDTYTVAWPEVVDQIWWKADMQQYDPEKYQGLLQRVLDHLNNKNATLYVKDVRRFRRFVCDPVSLRRRICDPRDLCRKHVRQEPAGREGCRRAAGR